MLIGDTPQGCGTRMLARLCPGRAPDAEPPVSQAPALLPNRLVTGTRLWGREPRGAPRLRCRRGRELPFSLGPRPHVARNAFCPGAARGPVACCAVCVACTHGPEGSGGSHGTVSICREKHGFARTPGVWGLLPCGRPSGAPHGVTATRSSARPTGPCGTQQRGGCIRSRGGEPS